MSWLYPCRYVDRAEIWADLTDIEQQQFKTLLGPPPLARDFAQRIGEALGWSSPGVAFGINCDLNEAIDRGELVAMDVVAVVGDRVLFERQKDVAIIAEVISQNPRLAKVWTDIMEVEKVSKS